MDYEIKFVKDTHSGNRAVTVVELPGVRSCTHTDDKTGVSVLDITTMKSLRGQLVTRASVYFRDASGSRSFAWPGDYSRSLAVAEGRATERALHGQQLGQLWQVPALVEEITQFYARLNAIAA